MQRTHDLFLKDILLAIRRIENYTEELTYEDFLKDELRPEVVVPLIKANERILEARCT